MKSHPLGVVFTMRNDIADEGYIVSLRHTIAGRLAPRTARRIPTVLMVL